jgi:integrase
MAYKSIILEGKKCFEVYLNGKDENGKRIQIRRRRDKNGELITSERKAKSVEFDLKTELNSKGEDGPTWTWNAWHDECLKRMKLTHKESTLQGYDGAVKKWLPKSFKDKELGQIEKADIHELIFETLAENGASAHLQKNTLKKIHKILDDAVEEGMIARNPASGLKVKVPATQKLVLTPGEVNLLLSAARDGNHRWYPHFALALFSGLRNGELYALRISDVDFEAGLIHVTKQFTSKDGQHETKGNSNRVIPISSQLRPFLEWLVTLGGHKETLWKWKNRKTGEKQSFVATDLLLPRIREWRSGEQAAILKDFCEHLGITPVKFHDLRATFITNLLAQGVSTTVVMAIVGHSKLSTTEEYLRLAGVFVQGGTEKLSYAISGGKPVEGTAAASGSVSPEALVQVLTQLEMMGMIQMNGNASQMAQTLTQGTRQLKRDAQAATHVIKQSGYVAPSVNEIKAHVGAMDYNDGGNVVELAAYKVS